MTVDTCQPIGTVRWRERARVTGRVRSLRVRPWGDTPVVECTLVDDTGGLTVVFLGRRSVAGIQPGSRLIVEGMVGSHHRRLAILNPDYELLDQNAL
jgi:RecG-like helicase